jgi:hypothetical protein
MCGEVLRDQDILELVDGELKQKFKQNMMDHFIEHNHLFVVFIAPSSPFHTHQ